MNPDFNHLFEECQGGSFLRSREDEGRNKVSLPVEKGYLV